MDPRDPAFASLGAIDLHRGANAGRAPLAAQTFSACVKIGLLEPRGIEPRFAECDSAVIPLDHGPGSSFGCRSGILFGSPIESRRQNEVRAAVVAVVGFARARFLPEPLKNVKGVTAGSHRLPK